MQVPIHNQTRCISAFLAFLLHALLCFLLFFFIVYQHKQAGSLGNQQQVSNDATDIMLEDLPEGTEEAPEPESSEAPVTPLLTMPPVHQAEALSETLTPVPLPLHTMGLTHEDSCDQHSSSQESGALHVQSFSEPVTPRKIRRKRRASKINFQQIANFMRNYSQERTCQTSASDPLPDDLGEGVYIDPKGVPHRTSDAKKTDSRYAHVEDDLARMAFYSYMKGVNQGLKTAFSIHRESIYFEESAQERHILEITIIADGTVAKVVILKSFGKHDFDDYVIRTIQQYQFAPIPKQLKTSHIIKRLDATVYARAGMNQFELIINY